MLHILLPSSGGFIVPFNLQEWTYKAALKIYKTKHATAGESHRPNILQEQNKSRVVARISQNPD